MSSRAFDIPKPDTGLAEWTSKIKAMQRQVDADEEAEQKRLEDEIAASRRARLRRSRSFRRDTDGTDLSQSQENLSPIKDSAEADSGTVSVNNQMTYRSSGKSEPISLAAFMGGRATGPRLNRHAPQQDAHDPTQFDKPDLRTPHPIFGRGGVAMPGMAAKKGSSSEKFDPEVVERYRPTSYLPNNQAVRQKSIENFQKSTASPLKPEHQERHTSATASARTYLPNRADSLSPQKTGNRERTISTPAVTKISGGLQPGSSSFSPTVPRERTTSTPGTAGREALTSTATYGTRSPLSDYQRATTPSRDSSTSSTSNVVSPSSKPMTPRTTIPASSASYPPQKTPIITPSLARPIQPENRVPPISPTTPTTASPSPAFLKPPPQKEPTPSISRLQGRGFVQNMVRASSSLESPSPPATSSSSEKSTPTASRKSSVLDRWQPNAGTSPMSSPSPSFPIRRSATFEPKQPTNEVQQSPQRSPSPTKLALTSTVTDSLMAHASRSHVGSAEREFPEHAPQLGSANTVFTVEQVTNSRSKLDSVDELGIKREASPAPKEDRFTRNPTPIVSAPLAKPLNHPTKGRARKPQKHSGARDSSRIIEDAAVGSHYHASSEPTIPARGPSPGFVERDEELSKSANFIDSAVSSASKIQRLAGTWANTGPISVKNIKAPGQSTETRSESTSNKSATRRALPGMTNSNEFPLKPPNQRGTLSDYQQPHPTMQRSVNEISTRAFSEIGTDKPPSPTVPLSPGRHTRIPTTGNRSTVMSVAQVLLDFSENYSKETEPLSPHPSKASAMLARGTIPSGQPESSRKSSYDKYSTLPPLKEEATPTPTPSGTLSRSANISKEDIQVYGDFSVHQTLSDSTQSSDQLDVDFPIPVVDVDAILRSHNASPPHSSDLRTIAVDVMSIIGTTATPLSQNTDTFYDAELLVIVHRSKSISSGLVSTIVWVWMGKDSRMGEREERKINELAKRYGTSAIFVPQYTEPTQLVRVLGDQLKIRQGTRTHWSAENTAMYIIRSLGGVIFIDQYDLNVKNLCSGFSYCITIMDTVYLWHGRGSSAQERQTALWYAQSIMNQGVSPIELSEGENDDDEMFWMILGDEAYANAHYWRWRRKSPATDPSVWRVDSNLESQPITPIHSILQEKALHNSIYIIDCIWESFVLVGQEARGKRRSIKLALDVALQMSERNASSRPYTPTVHALVLPSRLPLDLRLNLRGLDEAYLNDGAIPDHMNLLSSKEALSHLRKRSWERIALKDHDMLPLGVTVSDAA